MEPRLGLALRVYVLENSGEEKVVFEASLLAHSLILRGGFGSWLEAVDTPPQLLLSLPPWIFLGLYLALCDCHGPLTKNDQLPVLFLIHPFSFWKRDQSKN